MKRNIFIVLFLLLVIPTFAADKIRAYVYDEKKTPLIGANVYWEESGNGCSGNLYSISLTGDSRQNYSCCEEMKNAPKDDCTKKTQSDDNTTGASFIRMNENCCDFKQVELSTDAFHHQLQQCSPNNVLPSFSNVWLALSFIIVDYIALDSFIANVQHIFPPGGLSKLSTDRLSYICTYRI